MYFHRCKKDLMFQDGSISFTKNKLYPSKQRILDEHSHLRDNQGASHGLGGGYADDNEDAWFTYFESLTHILKNL